MTAREYHSLTRLIQISYFLTLLLGNKQLLSQTLGRFPGLLTSTQYSWTGFLPIVFGGTVQHWPLRLYLLLI